MTEQGIDVSNAQGARFAWGLQRGRIQFGAAKATEGLGFLDPDFGRNWDAMWRLQDDHRLPRFAYHFFHPGLDPREQAQVFVSTVRAHGLLAGDNLMADFEVTDGLPPAVVAGRGVQFLRHCNELAPGHRVLPYMSPSFAAAGHSAGMESWHLWVADYGVPRPAVPAPWSSWAFWQRGDSPIDTDVFNGTHEQLLEFCRMPCRR